MGNVLGAKLHGFDRSLVDIVKVVGAQVSTMTKRLREFTRTASSKLTIEEFYLVDLEEEHDPPSFHEMKKKRGINFPEFNEEEFQRLDSEIERNIQLDKQKRRNGKSSTESENDNSVASNGLYGLSESVVGTAMDLSQYMGLPKDALASIDGAIDGVTDVIKEALQTRIEAENSVDNAGYMPVTCESLGIDPLNPERAEVIVFSVNLIICRFLTEILSIFFLLRHLAHFLLVNSPSVLTEQFCLLRR